MTFPANDLWIRKPTPCVLLFSCPLVNSMCPLFKTLYCSPLILVSLNPITSQLKPSSWFSISSNFSSPSKVLTLYVQMFRFCKEEVAQGFFAPSAEWTAAGDWGPFVFVDISWGVGGNTVMLATAGWQGFLLGWSPLANGSITCPLGCGEGVGEWRNVSTCWWVLLTAPLGSPFYFEILYWQPADARCAVTVSRRGGAGLASCVTPWTRSMSLGVREALCERQLQLVSSMTSGWDLHIPHRYTPNLEENRVWWRANEHRETGTVKSVTVTSIIYTRHYSL